MTRAAVIAAVALSACAPGDPALERCAIASQQHEVRAADRKIIGAAADYPADTTLRAREAELVGSQRARRQVAWDAVYRALAPVALAEAVPAGAASLPTWHTFYGRDDVKRMFYRLYEQLGPDGRAARARLDPAALDAAFAWNPTALDELENWPASLWDAYLASLDEELEVHGVGGIGRVGYSASAARHAMASYPEILSCLAAGAPDAFVDGPGAGAVTMAREPVSLAACEQAGYGPYFVAGGETLRAALEPAQPDAVITVESETSGARVSCRGSCEIAGPGRFRVTVGADAAPVTAALAVEYVAPEPTWAACLERAFPVDAVLVKADWRRAQLGITLPVYDTSAAGLDRRLSARGAFAWGDGDGDADPGPDDIYTLSLPSGSVYRLAGLHLMTKELDHWLWITLWWSPDPDTDFGADRPARIAALDGPWRNYKMCAAVAFDERDPDPGGGFAASAPSLADALARVHGGVGAPSWCSNPYIERGAGNAATNCVGCHQHGGTGMRSEDILADPVAFPSHGRDQVRNNFPTDYAWAIDRGDRLGPMFEELVEYYDSAEP